MQKMHLSKCLRYKDILIHCRDLMFIPSFTSVIRLSVLNIVRAVYSPQNNGLCRRIRSMPVFPISNVNHREARVDPVNTERLS